MPNISKKLNSTKNNFFYVRFQLVGMVSCDQQPMSLIRSYLQHAFSHIGAIPTDARSFMDRLESEKSPNLSHIHYSVLALGDSNYPHYCACGKKLDAR